MLHLLCPEYMVNACQELSPEYFQRRGICGVILDLDNTIIPWDKQAVPLAIKQWVQSLKKSGISLCLLSNNRTERVADIAAELEVYFVTAALKPLRRGFKSAILIMDLPANQVAVVGDQLYTDILGGNRSGCHTIWVKPLSRQEFLGTKVTRQLEKLTVKLLCRRGLMSKPGRRI